CIGMRKLGLSERQIQPLFSNVFSNCVSYFSSFGNTPRHGLELQGLAHDCRLFQLNNIIVFLSNPIKASEKISRKFCEKQRFITIRTQGSWSKVADLLMISGFR
ncbi:MAG: hypothetical protein WCO51_03050, partial [bacterium]